MRPSTSATLLRLYSKPTTYDRFRGVLHIMARTTVSVVNEVPMEQYVQGVVPSEMPYAWPQGALRAQAVAARSYAAVRLHPTTGTYDLYDDSRSQVYRGTLGEHSTTTNATAATAGLVVMYGTSIANTLYHSAGGGATENNEYAFNSATGAVTSSPVAYLRGSSDRAPDGSSYDATSPYATWHTATYTLAQIQAWFAADTRTNVGTLVALDLTHRGVSGRLVSVTLIGADGSTKTVSGGVFVSIFNAHRPSTDAPMRDSLFDLAPIP
jgi:stage II sporulation protein D